MYWTEFYAIHLMEYMPVWFPVDLTFLISAGWTVTERPMMFADALPISIKFGIRNIKIFFQ
jgi:hypothetical protein